MTREKGEVDHLLWTNISPLQLFASLYCIIGERGDEHGAVSGAQRRCHRSYEAVFIHGLSPCIRADAQPCGRGGYLSGGVPKAGEGGHFL